MWQPVSATPKPDTPIVMKGPSGYITPNEVAYMSGFHSPTYADPWRDWGNNGLGDYGIEPTHWIYVSDLEYQIPYSAKTVPTDVTDINHTIEVARRSIAAHFQIPEYMLTGRPTPEAQAKFDDGPSQCSDNDPERDCRCGGRRGEPSCMFPSMAQVHSNDIARQAKQRAADYMLNTKIQGALADAVKAYEVHRQSNWDHNLPEWDSLGKDKQDEWLKEYAQRPGSTNK